MDDIIGYVLYYTNKRNVKCLHQPIKLLLKRIKALAWKHACYVKDNFGVEINITSLEERLYNEYIGGQITIDEINEDIKEYEGMQNNVV